MNPLKGQFKYLGLTPFSIVYAKTGDTKIAYKALDIRFEGQSFDYRPFACPGSLEREARVYDLLGENNYITKYYGAELDEESKIHALRLEYALLGCLRVYIVSNTTDKAPDLVVRLSMAVDFSKGVAHIHRCGIRWGDLSTRNALLFEGYRVRLCDFAAAIVPGEYEDITQTYESRYSVPEREGSDRAIDEEIFALGSAVYEITEWQMPYGNAADETIVDNKLHRGILPDLRRDNPAAEIIKKCWEGYYNDSADTVVTDMEKVLTQYSTGLRTVASGDA